MEEAAINYQSPSVIAVGADAQSVSLLALMVNLLLSIICLKAPVFIERIGLTKRGAVILALINVCVWIPLILSFLLFSNTVSPLGFVFLWLLNLVPAVLLSTQRDNWLSNMIPKDIMGRYLGRRMAIKSGFYLGSFCLFGYLLDSSANGAISGFCFIFFIAFLTAFLNFSIYWSMKDAKINMRAAGQQQQAGFGAVDFIKELKTRRLTKFILFTSLFSITISHSGPLYAVYMLKELDFGYLSFTIIIGTEYFTRIISMPFWGRLADRKGNIEVLSLVSRVIPFIPICWLFFSNLGYFIFIQAISGLCWGAYDLCTQNYLFKLAPPEKKLRYIMYSKSLTLFCMFLGGLLSVYLLDEIFPISGSRILSIFLISGIFRGLVALSIIPKLIDYAIKVKSTEEKTDSIKEMEIGPRPENRGLYYQPDSWLRYIEPEKPRITSRVKKDVKAAVSTAGLYYHLDKWIKYFTRTAVIPTGIIHEAVNPAAYHALYYDPASLMKYRNMILQKVHNQNQTRDGINSSKARYHVPANQKKYVTAGV